MVKLLAPLGCGGASVDGISYPVVDGAIDASAAHVKELLTNGFRLAPEELVVNWDAVKNDILAKTPAPSDDDPNDVPSTVDITLLNRTELFGYLRLHGIVVQPPVSKQQLFEIAVKAYLDDMDVIQNKLISLMPKSEPIDTIETVEAETGGKGAPEPEGGSTQATLQAQPASPALQSPAQNGAQSALEPATPVAETDLKQ